MGKILFAVVCWLWCSAGATFAEVLIIADEVPAMQVLATNLKTTERLTSRIVTQKEMPSELASFSAIVVYIHGGLNELAEKACINYAENGGKLVLLHHSISSGKRVNKYWFPFLGVSLPVGDVDKGGYKWIEPVTLELVNLAPEHYITTHLVKYEGTVAFGSSSQGGERQVPGFTLKQTEVYLNHVLTGPRTVLMGFKYTDAQSGKTYLQETAGWHKRVGKGTVIYLMAGHSSLDFENAAYGQIVVNAVTWRDTTPPGKVQSN
jgi:hypothetical protein